MMDWFKNLSIQHKLSLIITLTSVIVLFFASVALILNDLISFRDATVKDLSTLAEVIGMNSTAAMAFNDQKSAEETLAALKAVPNIVTACIYTKENRVFATYFRDRKEENLMAAIPAAKEGYHLLDNCLDLYKSIVLDGEPVGTVYIRSDLEKMRSRLNWYAGIGIIVMISFSFLAYLLSSRLQTIISRPITHLTQTIRSVSNSKDYSIRGTKESSDELGVLIDGFNEMLSQIQQRDKDLQVAQIELRNRAQDLQKELIQREGIERTLKELTRELSRSNKDLEQFAYVASHDLQEPLRMVTSFMQLLSQRYKGHLDATADKYIDFATDGATRMHRLINDLLTYSRVGTKGKELATTDSKKVLEHSLDNLKLAIEENGARVTHDPLPIVMGDDVQLGQLFQNLIGNAIKFRGEEPSRVHILADLHNGDWIFSVRDNGIGIAPEHAERIFVIFQRLHHRAKYPGTGIGLAVCKKIVERHGGRIWVESEPGKGATFYFTIPERKAQLS